MDKITKEELDAVMSLNVDRPSNFLGEYLEIESIKHLIECYRAYLQHLPKNELAEIAKLITQFEFGFEIGRIIERRLMDDGD